jgi:hypothetical protein
MRELNLTEIETVSGGETVMEPIIVVDTRPGSRSVYAAEWEARGMTAQEYVFGSGDGGGLLQLAGLPIEGVYTDDLDDIVNKYADETQRDIEEQNQIEECMDSIIRMIELGENVQDLSVSTGNKAGEIVGGIVSGPFGEYLERACEEAHN